MGYALWEALQWILAPRCGRLIRRTVREHFSQIGAGRWLDVGCGPRSLIAQTLPGTVVGIDCSTEILHETQRDNVTCITATATALPFTAESFDGVVSFGMLHHVSEQDAETALTEMRRVTRPGGVVLLFDSVSPVSSARRPLAALLRKLDHGCYVRDEATLRRLLNHHGFDIGRRITYSWTGLEGCWAVLVNSGRENVERHIDDQNIMR
jgi:ubiquinone/menaquinone biosynthesis C-methylase UbiE